MGDVEVVVRFRWHLVLAVVNLIGHVAAASATASRRHLPSGYRDRKAKERPAMTALGAAFEMGSRAYVRQSLVPCLI